MAREPTHVLELRRALGHRLAVCRQTVGWSQRRLAQALHYHRTAISHIEAGRHPAPRDFWERADQLLAAGGILLAAYDAVATAKHEVAVRAAEAASAVTGRQRHALSGAGASQDDRSALGNELLPGVSRAHSTAGSGEPDQSVGLCWESDQERAADAVIQLWTGTIPTGTAHAVDSAARTASNAAALTWLFTSSPNCTERTSGARSVGVADVEALSAMQRSLIALDDKHGGEVVLPMAVAYLRSEVSPLLQGRYTDKIGQRLFAAAAELVLVTGRIAYDAGQHGVARRHLVQALRLSHVAADRAIGGRVLTTMSHQALYLGDRDDALVLARAASRGVRTCAPVVQAIAAATEARALAAGGSERRACFGLMDKAERVFAKARAGDAPAWLTFLDEAELAGKFGRCLRDMGLYTDAERQLEISLTLHKVSYPRSRAITQIVYATTYARQRQLERACQLGTAAIPVMGRLRSQRAREYLRELRDQLAPYQHEPLVQQFDDQVREILPRSG